METAAIRQKQDLTYLEWTRTRVCQWAYRRQAVDKTRRCI